MSAKTLAFAAEYPGLSAVERAVLLILCNMAHKARGNTCFPSQKYIALAAGTSSRTAKRVLASLVEKGAIKRDVRRNKKGHRTSDLYTICLGAKSAPRKRQSLGAKSAKSKVPHWPTNPSTPYGVTSPILSPSQSDEIIDVEIVGEFSE